MAATKMQPKIDICILVTMHMSLIPKYFKSIINVNISFFVIFCSLKFQNCVSNELNDLIILSFIVWVKSQSNHDSSI